MARKDNQYENQQAGVVEDEIVEYKDDVDICQQLMDRYAKSSALQHRHLVATAAAMRSMLVAEALPLTPRAFLAACISSVDSAMNSPSMDHAATSALLSFLSIVVPAVPTRGITTDKASEAVAMLALLLEKEEGKLGVSSLRAGVKCLGALMVGFCDLNDWNPVHLGFSSLVKFSINKRPKVRRCAQEYLEKAFSCTKSSLLIKEASKLIYSLLKEHMPVAEALSLTTACKDSKVDSIKNPENLEVLQVLNLLGVVVPFLSVKIRSKVLSALCKILSSEFSALTRQIFKAFDIFFEASREEMPRQHTKSIITILTQYVSTKNKNPADTIVHATNLLGKALMKLRSMNSRASLEKFPLVCDSIAGLLNSMDDRYASQALVVLKDMINHHIDHNVILALRSNSIEDKSSNDEAVVMVRATCVVFEKSLNSCDAICNKHILDIISLWFQRFGELSYKFMSIVVCKLSGLMNSVRGDASNLDYVQNCIGSAVEAMGPERILKLIPISYCSEDFTCSNTWLIPILKKHVVGASLSYYVEDIVPLAKSFLKASQKVGDAAVSEELQAYACSLFGLLPAFCHYATDTRKTFGSLVELIVIFLKKYPFMREVIACSLQVLVNENQHIFGSRKKEVELSRPVMQDLPLGDETTNPYSKEVAARNLKVLASSSPKLLEALVDIFIVSPPRTCSYLKDTIGCLASITDSSVIKRMLIAVLEKYKFIDGKVDSPSLQVQAPKTDKKMDSSYDEHTLLKRCVFMDLFSSLIRGATDQHVELIYNVIVHTFQNAEEIGHGEAYHTLSRLLQELDLMCSSHFVELLDILLQLKPPDDIVSLRSRFDCFHIIMFHAYKTSSEEGFDKAFLVLNEIILTLKDGSEEARKAAYDALIAIYYSLRSCSVDGTDPPFHKFISMLIGYLSGSSPHIKSGAISALSVLLFKDPELCLSMPDLIPSVLSQLHCKAIEIIKAALGFAKVTVSCLEFKNLGTYLSDILSGILPWSSVSRHHFRNKVIVILEIVIRKCGPTAVGLVTPEKYKGFIRSVKEHRSAKSTSKGRNASSETLLSNSTKGSSGRKRKQQEDASDLRNDRTEKKARRRKTLYSTSFSTKRSDVPGDGNSCDKEGSLKRPRQPKYEKKRFRKASANGLKLNIVKRKPVKRVSTSRGKRAPASMSER